MGGVVFTNYADSKTGQPLMEVLREKHPSLSTPDLSNPACTYLEGYNEDPDVFTLEIYEEDVQWVAT